MNAARTRLARFLRTHRRLASAAHRAVLAGDEGALQRQAMHHLYVIGEVQRMRADPSTARSITACAPFTKT